jgi:hypothetical protein
MRDVATSGSRRSGLHSGRRREREKSKKLQREKKTKMCFSFRSRKNEKKSTLEL